MSRLAERLLKDLSPHPAVAVRELAARVVERFQESNSAEEKNESKRVFCKFAQRFFPEALETPRDVPLEMMENSKFYERMLRLASELPDTRWELETQKKVDDTLDRYAEDSAGTNWRLAKLDLKEKEDCHAALGLLREVIEKSSLDAAKKNAILTKVSQISAEIDKDYTQTDGVMAILGDWILVRDVFGPRAEEAARHIRRLFDIVFGRRAANQGLPAPDPTRALPSK